MIKRWKLKNFKSFRDPPELKLSSINILAGANSSGKSSFIQSILLLKQTVQYGAPDRSIALNGPLLRMGEFNDVRNFDAELENLAISFELEPDPAAGSGVSSWSRQNIAGFYPSIGNVRSVTVETEFKQVFAQDPTDGALKTKVALQRSVMTSSYNNEEEKEPSFVSLVSKQNVSFVTEGAPINPFEEYEIGIDAEGKTQMSSSRPSLSIRGGSARHFLPDSFLLSYDAAAQKSAELATFIVLPSQGLARHSNFGSEVISPSVVKVLNKWLEKNAAKPFSEPEPVTAAQIRQHLSSMIAARRGGQTWGLKLSSDEALLRSILTEALLAETKSELTFDIDAPRVSRISGEYVRDFFKQGIRYLGPLRDAPRPVYPLEALESTTEVGYRGEHTAAVFQLNSHTHVSLHMPPGEHFDSDYITEARRVRLSLHDATISWLSYLGVADEVKATDSGVFGNRLQVATDSIDRWHDLTNVGVGVSQVLPLVVTALLARPGSLLIFEQPELHLHPRVQARLADFFLALALDGKQMLLETHSEYLIDRFRLRVALSESDAVRPLMSILFTEKHRGQSHITPVEVTEFGAIANWPKDFFDQSQKDVARLLKAASKRRARGVQLR